MNKFIKALSNIFPSLRKKDLVPMPGTRARTRTGELRYSAGFTQHGYDDQGRKVAIYRYDQITIQDLKRHRKYPPVADGIAARTTPISRVRFHFECADTRLADLAQQTLTEPISSLYRQLARGSFTFGFQVVEPRWKIEQDVIVTSGQSGLTEAEYEWPFIWAVDRFAELDPVDVQLYVEAGSGNFAGIRQLNGSPEMVPATSLIHHAYDSEFDLLYGNSGIENVVPIIEGAEAVFDAMLRHSERYGSPWTIGKYPEQLIATGEVDANGNPIGISASGQMMDMVETLDAGAKAVIPSSTSQDGTPKWGIEVIQPSAGADTFVEKLEWLNKMIRLGMSVPEMVTSSSPDAGTYNLGTAIIDLYLSNMEDDIRAITVSINKQFMRRWTELNGGATAPPCLIVTEPIGPSVHKALLQTLLSRLQGDFPIEDSEGNTYEPDWSKIASDNGLPLFKVDAVRKMRDELTKRLATIDDDRQGEPAADRSALLSEDQDRCPEGSEKGGQFGPQEDCGDPDSPIGEDQELSPDYEYKTSSGSTVFGIIPDEVEINTNGRIKARPIKVLHGIPGAEGWGVAHHEEDRLRRFREAGFSTPEDFYEYVLGDPDMIAEQNNGRLLIAKRREKNHVAVVELRKSGDFYTVTTGVPATSQNYLRNKTQSPEGESRVIWAKAALSEAIEAITQALHLTNPCDLD